MVSCARLRHSMRSTKHPTHPTRHDCKRAGALPYFRPIGLSPHLGPTRAISSTPKSRTLSLVHEAGGRHVDREDASSSSQWLLLRCSLSAHRAALQCLKHIVPCAKQLRMHATTTQQDAHDKIRIMHCMSPTPPASASRCAQALHSAPRLLSGCEREHALHAASRWPLVH